MAYGNHVEKFPLAVRTVDGSPMVLTLKLRYPNHVQPELGVAVGQLELFARDGWYAIKTPVAVQQHEDDRVVATLLSSGAILLGEGSSLWQSVPF